MTSSVYPHSVTLRSKDERMNDALVARDTVRFIRQFKRTQGDPPPHFALVHDLEMTLDHINFGDEQSAINQICEELQALRGTITWKR